MKKFHVEYLLKSGHTLTGLTFDSESMKSADNFVWSIIGRMKPDCAFDIPCSDGCQRMFFLSELSYLTIKEE